MVLDTVNPNGYADGSIDQTQFTWLKSVLAASTDRLVMVFSHHTSDTMTNGSTVPGSTPTPGSSATWSSPSCWLTTR